MSNKEPTVRDVWNTLTSEQQEIVELFIGSDFDSKYFDDINKLTCGILNDQQTKVVTFLIAEAYSEFSGKTIEKIEKEAGNDK